MEAIKLDDVIKAVEGTVLSGNVENKQILSVATDSRENIPQGLFIAIKGENVDGHMYIECAARNGAIATLVSDEQDTYIDEIVYIKVEDTIKGLQDLASWYRSQFNIPVVAITGSVGKTTTKDMVSSVLGRKYNVLKTQGNFNSDIGAPMTVLGLNKSHEIAVIEMGMDHLRQIAGISRIVKPDTAVITNVGVAHLEYLKTRENILKAKCEVFENMDENTGIAILNKDNDMLSTVDNNFKKVWFGKENNADIFVKNVQVDYTDGVIKAEAYVKNIKYNLIIPGLSEHLVYSAMAAIAVGLRYNMTVEETLQGVLDYTHTKMRMDIYKLEDNILVIDDTYNANPDSMKSLIDTVKRGNKENKILILGDMFELGENSIELHKQVLEYAINARATKIVVTGENMKKAANEMKNDVIMVYDNKEELIEDIDKIIEKNSIVALKASRGMKFENITEKILEKYKAL